MHHSTPISPFEAAAVLIAIAATLGYVNMRFLRLPQTIGLTIMGAVASLVVIAVDRFLPSELSHGLAEFITGIDFHSTLMDGMLSFLLFAGALHVDWSEMQRGRWPILALSTVGVVVSTVTIGYAVSLATGIAGINLPFAWCLVFGALISPTDPVAVMGVMKEAKVPATLQATVAGESLFNDGVGVVVFSIVLAAAFGTAPLSVGHGLHLFVVEAGGGVMLGLVIGWLAYRAMHGIDDYKVEVMITLAVVMAGYALAARIHVSGPVAMAVAGLIVGNHGVAHAMSDTTQDHLLKFWELIDDVLNSVLFLLIGLEVIAVAADPRLLLVGFAAVPIVLLGRVVSVVIPLLSLKPIMSLGRLAAPTLIWGGLRGGISVALALSLPAGPARTTILTATYLVVLFSVIVQGGTIEKLIRRMSSRP